jgi:hypothetical protein
MPVKDEGVDILDCGADINTESKETNKTQNDQTFSQTPIPE